MAKGGGSEIGTTKRGKGMKIMAIVDRHGLPLSVSTHAANHHEVRLLQLCFDFYMIEAKPENLIGDRAHDSDPLDAELRKDGIEMIAPHRGNRSKPPTQDRRRLSRSCDAGSSSASSPGFNGSAFRNHVLVVQDKPRNRRPTHVTITLVARRFSSFLATSGSAWRSIRWLQPRS
jgi:hypothetical protein